MQRCGVLVCALMLLCHTLTADPVEVVEHPDASMTVATIYGNMDVQDPLVCDIIRSPEFARLKDIHQYGAWDYVVGPAPYTRWHHSLGVFYLTALYGGDYYEQIAALLHDISHTVFSHSGGWIYYTDRYYADGHQDEIHQWFIEQSNIARLLNAHGIHPDHVHHKKGHFPRLEQPLPHVCADRLDYNLQGAYYEGTLSYQQVHQVLKSLYYEYGVWFFDDVKAASMLAQNSVYMTRNIWGSPASGITNAMLGRALKRALDIGIVTSDDIHFSSDQPVWSILQKSDDPYIQQCMFLIARHQSLFFIDDQDYDMRITAKCRAIDPYVKINGSIHKLSAYDAEFARLFTMVKREVAEGWPIRCVYKRSIYDTRC